MLKKFALTFAAVLALVAVPFAAHAAEQQGCCKHCPPSCCS